MAERDTDGNWDFGFYQSSDPDDYTEEYRAYKWDPLTEQFFPVDINAQGYLLGSACETDEFDKDYERFVKGQRELIAGFYIGNVGVEFEKDKVWLIGQMDDGDTDACVVSLQEGAKIIHSADNWNLVIYNDEYDFGTVNPERYKEENSLRLVFEDMDFGTTVFLYDENARVYFGVERDGAKYALLDELVTWRKAFGTVRLFTNWRIRKADRVSLN